MTRQEKYFLDQARDLYRYNGIVADGYQVVDGEIVKND